MANSMCERVIGSLRREYLDFLIPLTQRHLRHVVREWADYYNAARPHMSLGPGIPEPTGAVTGFYSFASASALREADRVRSSVTRWAAPRLSTRSSDGVSA